MSKDGFNLLVMLLAILGLCVGCFALGVEIGALL